MNDQPMISKQDREKDRQLRERIETLRKDREKDREMDKRIEELRKKQLRREKLTYDEWEIIQYGSQSCHCGQGTVQ